MIDSKVASMKFPYSAIHTSWRAENIHIVDFVQPCTPQFLSRFTVLASAVPSLTGWTVIAAAPGSVSTAVLGRFFIGVGMGIAGAIYPVG